MAIDGITMGFTCVLLLPGAIFMATNKKVAMNAVKEAGFEKSINNEALALAAYYLFLLGAVLFELASVILCLTLGVSAPLAVCAGTAGVISILLMMAITKESITGIPGISGPPMPARILIGLIGLLLNVNAILHIFDGDIPSDQWVSFAIVYVISCVVPHGIAFKHRKEGWSTPPMV